MRHEIDSLTIEVTRKCNIQCDHCMRGDAQNLDMDTKYVSRLFEQVTSINQVVFTGGEPSLVPHIISDIFDIADNMGTDIESFYIATNAVQISTEFLDVLLKAYLHCSALDYIDSETRLVDISSDMQHAEASDIRYDERQENIKKLMAFRFVSKRNENTDYREDGAIQEGRAAELIGWGRYSREPSVGRVRIEDDRISSLYLNSLGNVLEDGNLSFDSQDDSDIIICNVGRKNYSLLNSIKRYNKRIDDDEINSIKVEVA